jgi:hypothetical protein
MRPDVDNASHTNPYRKLIIVTNPNQPMLDVSAVLRSAGAVTVVSLNLVSRVACLCD